MIATHFLFSAHPLRRGEVEPEFADQFAAARSAGFTASSVADAVIDDGRPLIGLPPGSVVIYRGWMLDAAQYQRLAAAIVAAGATPLTTVDEYLAAHHLPRWYPAIADLTPETHVFPNGEALDLPSSLRALGWTAFFVKDYVKSLKTAPGAILRDPAKIDSLLDAMRDVRGTVEGGVCVRRVEAFAPLSERRFFALRGRAFAADGIVPDIVDRVVERIRLPFFSIDVARRDDGVDRVVEIGDGQVSDLVGWTASRFVACWRDREREAFR